MSAPAKGGAFAVILIAVFALASLAGAELNPSVDATPEHNEGNTMEVHQTSTTSSEDDIVHGQEEPAATLPGLASAQDGYRLIPEETGFRGGEPATLSFQIVDADGEVVRDFDTVHARRMHLIVVRRDFANFQHLHPQQLADGTWEAEADFRQAGVYRAFADFSTEGQSLTLAGDLFVAGEFDPQPLPPVSSTADAGDGYEVELASPEPQSASATPVRFQVTLDGRRLEGVEPYLGADGHLVALRQHDQAFLHTHPEGEAGGSGPIAFKVHYPTPGSYRLFLQFKHDRQVRTAAFTQVAAGRASSEPGHGIADTEASAHMEGH